MTRFISVSSRPGQLSLLVAAACLTLCLRTSAAARDSITDLVPADSMVMYAAKPYSFLSAGPATSATSSPDEPAQVPISSIIAFLNAAGLIPGEGQVYADIVTALPLLGRFEHAAVLLDISTQVIERSPEGGATASAPAGRILRLDQLQAAVIFRTGGDDQVVLEQLNRVIGRYTNREVAMLTSHESAGINYQRLADERLKDWAIWEWGKIGDYYVVGFGEGAFERIIRVHAGGARSMTHDPWYVEASEKTRAAGALAHWFVGFSRLKERLGDAAEGRVARVAAALQASNMTHDLWAIAQEGRALAVRRCYRRGDENVVRSYSEPSGYASRYLSIIPPKARRLAIVNVPTRWLVDNLPRAWVAAQSASNVRKWEIAWERLNEEKGLDISANLIDHLGDTVVIFDYPEHPLKIPFALTIAIEINDPKAVRMATDALLDAWGQYLDDRAERNKTVLVRAKVHHDEDGVWYLQLGILGPAMKVTDRFLVLSWSPQALRDALKYIEPDERTGNRR